MNPKATPPKDPAEREPSSPYGPQPYGDDESAGGADSSPHETESSGDNQDQPPPPPEGAK